MARKKKKKPGQQRTRQRFPARHGVGHHVRVKPGTTDPDFPDIPLGGWAGAIMDVDQRSNPPIYLIEWNQHTLDHMHPVYRKRCERDGLELERMWLGENDIEPDSGGPAVIEQPTSIVTRPLSKNDQDDRIRAIFGLTSDDPLPPTNVENLRRYGSYLRRQLSFPFEGSYTAEIGPFEEAKYLITVLGILDDDNCDEEEGVLCRAEQHGESVELPLANLEVPDNSYHRQLVEDYSYWFGNWPADDFTAPAARHREPFETHTGPPGKWSFLKTLVQYGLYGAAYGVVLGSLLGALEGARTGALVGAAMLGLVGLAAGAKYGMVVGLVNRVRYASLAGGFLGALAGVLVGAVIGAMVVAFAGTLVGGIIGALVGSLLAKLQWKRLGTFEGTIIGAGVGAVVAACCRDQEEALAWAFHGAWLGACAAVLLVLAAVGSLALAARNRSDG
jgi:hypothetical protein